MPLMEGVPSQVLSTVTVSSMSKTDSYATGAAIWFNCGE